MDVYTTSFCLPHRAAHADLEAAQSPAFELPRDVAAAAAANNHASASTNSNSAVAQQAQPPHPPQHHHHHSYSYSVSQAQPSSSSSTSNAAAAASSALARHQPSRSVSYTRPASIPEGHEDSSVASIPASASASRLGDSTGSSSSQQQQQAQAAAGSAGPALARRSTSSIASLNQHTTAPSSVASTAGDNISTAPSSQLGHHQPVTHRDAFANSTSTGVSSVPPAKQSSNVNSNAGAAAAAYGAYAPSASVSASASAAQDPATAAALAQAQQRAAAEIADAVQKLCMEAMSSFQCMVTCTPLDMNNHSNQDNANGSAGGASSSASLPPGSVKGYNFILSGGYQQVMGARGFIMRSSPFKNRSVVKVPRSEVLDAREAVKIEMRKKLDEIAALTKAHLAIVGQVSGTIGFGLETERNVEIVITGSYESVEQARVRLLVLLDELAGLHSDVCEIDYKLHNIISGRKRVVIQTIQEETATNIYFPTPLTGIISPRDPALLAKQNLIFITGEFFGVQRARDMLFQVSIHKSKCIISRDAALLPRKLDWLLSDKLEEVKNVMLDNGTFINFPMIGSQASLMSVYGDQRVNIERTLRAIMHLACQFYVSQFWLLPMNFDVFMPPPTINPSQVPAILKLISAATGAETVFKSNCFEFHGVEAEIRTAVQLVLELDIVKAFHHEIRFQIELASEHRDFISGKKNGKLNKVMKTAGVKIKFETFNDYNFLIDIAGNNTGALHGLSLLQEELPAEVSFHVPETYHKRIIGVGGKNIQRIMKKFGVYVKFSNAEEFASLGGYYENEDNVIARTPAKNIAALDQLKASVMEMVIPKDKDYVVETVSIPRRYHRTLLGEKSIFIHDIESKTNSTVRFPNKETAADIVSIFGPESQVHIAAQMLLDHVPFEAEYRLPHSEQMSQLALAPEFLELQDKIKRDLNITILPWVDRSGNGEETVIRFLLNRSNQHFLTTARDTVEEFLLAQQIPLYPSSLRPRSDSFATSFPFFNSKLLSTLGENEVPTTTNTEDPSRPSLRTAASTPDIKAIFEAPTVPRAYSYLPPENAAASMMSTSSSAGQASAYYQYPQQQQHQYAQQMQQQYSQQQQQYSHQQQLYPQHQQSHQHQHQPRTSSPAVPQYQPLTTPRFGGVQAPTASNAGHGSNSISQSATPSYPSPYAPSHTARLSDEAAKLPLSSTTKRESDPLMDDKLKELVRRGALGHHLNARAQSLDISQQTKTFGRHAAADSEAVGAALSQLRL